MSALTAASRISRGPGHDSLETSGKVVEVKQERDGGWPEAYQLERQRPFDDAEYQRLYPWFFEEQDVCAGVRESRTRSGTLR
eukprot:COSAG01_NODE_20587_length_946_cov_1.440378_2_plen_81_part_01